MFPGLLPSPSPEIFGIERHILAQGPTPDSGTTYCDPSATAPGLLCFTLHSAVLSEPVYFSP